MTNAYEGHAPLRGLRTRTSSFVNWFIPTRVRDGDPEMLRRARLAVTFTLALIGVGLFYTPVYYLMDSPKNAMAIVVAMSVALPILYVMRRTGSPTLAGNLIAAAFFGVMTVQACRLGGHQSLILPWYATVPVVVLSTAGRRSALCWLVVTSWSLAAFYAISEMGYSLPNDLPPYHYELLRLLVWVGLGVLFLVLALLYEQAKNQTLADLQAAETNLRQERNFSDLAIASMPGIFYLFDSKGRFLRWNDNFERVSGYTADELSGLRLLDLFRNPDRGIMAQSVQDVFTKGQATPEAALMTKEGTAIPYLFSGRRILIDGKPHVIGMGMDIAARKQNEAAMQEAKDQADANAKRAEQALTDVGRLNAVMMGREQRVMEMKREVNELLAELGRAEKYEHV